MRRPPSRPNLRLASLGILFVVALLCTLLLVWPDQRGAAAIAVEAAAAAAPIPVVVPPAALVATPEPASANEDEPTLRMVATMAEPALLDLIEDARSADPLVRDEAELLLRDR